MRCCGVPRSKRQPGGDDVFSIFCLYRAAVKASGGLTAAKSSLSEGDGDYLLVMVKVVAGQRTPTPD